MIRPALPKSFLRAGSLLAGLGCLAIGTSQPASAFSVYTASEAGNFVVPFAAGQAAESNFKANLPGNITDSLNALTPGASNGQTIFGGLATVSGPLDVSSNFGCYADTQCINGVGNWSLAFTQPVQGFGFWANDQNTVGDTITLLVNGTAFTLGPVTETGNASFYGFIADNPSEAISSIEFVSGNPGGGYLAYDEFTTALPHNQVPGPLPLFGAATAFGFSRRLRKRIQGARG